MKNINYTNYFMTGIPCALGILGFLLPQCWFVGALFTILTGAFQFIVGTGILIDSGGQRKEYVMYFAGTIAFFMLWIFTDWHYVFVLPPVLALYLSVLLYIDAKKEDHEP